MSNGDIRKMISSMSDFGYSAREIAYAMDIRTKDVNKLLSQLET